MLVTRGMGVVPKNIIDLGSSSGAPVKYKERPLPVIKLKSISIEKDEDIFINIINIEELNL